MPDVIVADAADLAAVRELWTEYWASAGLDPQFQGFADELAALPSVYAPPAGRLLLATVDGHPAATAALRPLDRQRAEMKRLYVRPGYRGLGLARRLLDRLTREARAAG
jgi:GNAT superfamily N-acetyltransferase